jgi:poly(3-hydroxyalkanoate) synthetase
LATGDFVALGWRIDLSKLHCPMFLLAARDDNIVTSEQILATERLVGHGHGTITKAIALCGHLGLFTGRMSCLRVGSRSRAGSCSHKAVA